MTLAPPLFIPSTPAQMKQLIEQTPSAQAAQAAQETLEVKAVAATSKDEWLRERDEIIAEAKTIIERKNDREQSLIKTLDEQNDEIDQLKSKLAGMQSALDVAKDELLAADNRNASLKKALDEKSAPAPASEPATTEGVVVSGPVDAPVIETSAPPASAAGPDSDGVPFDP